MSEQPKRGRPRRAAPGSTEEAQQAEAAAARERAREELRARLKRAGKITEPPAPILMTEPGKRPLLPKQHAFVLAVVRGLTIEQAAEVAGYNKRYGAMLWATPEIRQAVSSAQTTAMERAQREMASIQSLAVARVGDLLRDPDVPHSVTLEAAKVVLDRTGMSARQVFDLSADIRTTGPSDSTEDLEAQLAAQLAAVAPRTDAP